MFCFAHAFHFGLQSKEDISGVFDHDVRGHQWERKRMKTVFDLLAVTNRKHYDCNCVPDIHRQNFSEDIHWNSALPITLELLILDFAYFQCKKKK